VFLETKQTAQYVIVTSIQTFTPLLNSIKLTKEDVKARIAATWNKWQELTEVV